MKSVSGWEGMIPMLEQLIHRVESSLFQLLQNQREIREEKIAELSNRIASSRFQLQQTATELYQLRITIHDQEIAATLLQGQIESSLSRQKRAQAFRQALELDRIRRDLAQMRDAMQSLEQLCKGLNTQIRDLRDELALLKPKP